MILLLLPNYVHITYIDNDYVGISFRFVSFPVLFRPVSILMLLYERIIMFEWQKSSFFLCSSKAIF